MADHNLTVPEGGCLKASEGTWFQAFDKDGNCVGQSFVAGDSVYEESDGSAVDIGDKRTEFYFPFSTENPKHQCPQYTCPGCGSHRLEEVMTDVTMTTEIVDVGEGGDLEYSVSGGAGDSGDVDRYQCLNCGHVVTDASGEKVTDSEGLAIALGVDTAQADE